MTTAPPTIPVPSVTHMPSETTAFGSSTRKRRRGGGKNAGLRAATGEYLSFADSDDFLEPGAYAYMMSLLKENGADIVRCAFQNRFRTRTEQWLADESRCVMEGKAFLARFTTDWTCGLLWNKLYKRALFDGIFFEEGHKIDDEYFTYQGVMNAAKVVCDPRVVYNYRQRASSVMQSPAARAQIAIDRIDFMAKRRERCWNASRNCGGSSTSALWMPFPIWQTTRTTRRRASGC